MNIAVSLSAICAFARSGAVAALLAIGSAGGAFGQSLQEAGEYVTKNYLTDASVQADIISKFSIAKDAFDCFAISTVFYKGIESGEVPQEMSLAAMSMALFSNFALENMGFSKEQIAQASVDAMARLETDGYYDYAFDSCLNKVKSIADR